MKRQQLSNSIWLASTAAIFASAPAWAAPIKVTGVQVKPTVTGVEVILETPRDTSPRFLTSSFGRTLNADIINTQLRLPKGNAFRASNPIAGIVDVKVKPLNANSVRISVTGKAKAPVGKLVQSDRGLVLSLRSTSSTSKHQISSQRKQLPSSSFLIGQQPQQPASGDNRNTQVVPSASPNSRARLLQLLRQGSSPANSDIPTQKVPIPNYLNPSPNPLQFPTKPEEVRILGIEPITLQQAFELARRNNQELRVAELNLERSRAALREARAELYPDLNLNSSVTRSQSAGSEISAEAQERQNDLLPENNILRQLTTGSQENGNSASTALNGTLELSYNIYTSGQRAARIRAAEEQVRFDQLDFERLSEQLRLDVANDYYSLQRTDEQVRISRSAVTNAQANLRDAQAREQAGIGTRFEVLQAQVQLADETQNLTNALSQQVVARRQLATRINVADSITVATADPVEIAGLWNLSQEESIVLAFRNRAELEQQLAQRNISEQRRRAALATLGPQVSLVTSYNVLDVFDDDISITDGYSIGGRVLLNLYDGGAARARARQEEANIAIAETQFSNQQNQIRFQVEQAYANLLSNLENIQTASVALEQAREALRLARLRFQAGVGTQTDVITQQNALTEAEGRRVNAILDYNRALAQLQRAISSGQQL